MFSPSRTHSGSPCRTSTISIGTTLTVHPPCPLGGRGPVSSCAVDQPTPSHRADWYPDPTGRFEFRYHNGVSWTGDVSADGHRFLDPLRAPTMGSAPPPFATVPFRESTGTAKAKASFILALCSFLVGWVPFLCVLAAAAAILALIFGIGVLRRHRREQRPAIDRPGRGYAVAGLAIAPIGLVVSGIGVWLSVLTLREVRSFTEVGRYSTTDVSCTVDSRLATYRGTITNESGRTRSYEVTVEFLRPGTSVRRYIASTSVDDVEPGATANVIVNEVVTDEELDCNLVSVTGPLPFGQS